MQKLIFFLIILLASVWAGLLISADPGYALFAYHNWTVEMPLWFAFIAMLVALGLFHLFVRILHSPSMLSKSWHVFLIKRRLRRAHDLTSRGMIALAEGHWQLAEKDLIRAVTNSATPFLNYIGAARAAQAQGDEQQRDYYLELANSTSPEAGIAVGIVQAQLQWDAKQWLKALDTLEQVLAKSPTHPYALKLKKDLLINLGDWQQLSQCLPTLRKYRAVSSEEYGALLQKVHKELLLMSAKSPSPSALTQYWEHLPKDARRDSDLIFTYVSILMSRGENNLAEEILYDALKRSRDDQLMYLFGKLTTNNPDKQLEQAEKWLKTNQNDAMLLLTLGRLCLKNQLWGKARSYFENSLHIEKRPETYTELGKLLEHLGEHSAATQCYREGLALKT